MSDNKLSLMKNNELNWYGKSEFLSVVIWNFFLLYGVHDQLFEVDRNFWIYCCLCWLFFFVQTADCRSVVVCLNLNLYVAPFSGWSWSRCWFVISRKSALFDSEFFVLFFVFSNFFLHMNVLFCRMSQCRCTEFFLCVDTFLYRMFLWESFWLKFAKHAGFNSEHSKCSMAQLGIFLIQICEARGLQSRIVEMCKCKLFHMCKCRRTQFFCLWVIELHLWYEC